jgi:hypothetical protein
MNPTAASRHALLRVAPTLARRVTAAVALTAVVLGVSACGSSSSPPATTTATTSAGGSTTSAATATTVGASGSASLTQFESKLASGQTATFVAVYHVSGVSDGNSDSGTFTIAHDGSSSLFGITETKGAFEEISAGGKVTICAKEAAGWTCFGGSLGSEFGASLDPFLDLYSAKAQAAQLKAEEAAAFDVTTSSKTVAGQSVSCVTYHSHTDSAEGTICVTSQGVMAEAFGSSSSGKWTLTLTSFSSNVPSNEFTLPATPTTIP